MIVSWGVRFLIHGGLGGGVLEDAYCQRAKAIRESKIKTAKDLSQEISEVVPSDRAFEDAFTLASVSQAFLARYYLRALEKQACGKPDPELVPNANEEEITLEHILPSKPANNWPQFDEETTQAYHRRLGNMALLQHKLNSSLKSATFSKKKEVFEASHFMLTKEVGNEATWDSHSIQSRQQRLAKLAVKTWPIKLGR